MANATVRDGKLVLTAQEQAYLNSFLKAGDRGGFYVAYYNMTGSEQALEQAQISTFSDVRGGIAFAANRLLQDYYGASNQYEGIYYLSHQVALNAFAAILGSAAPNRSGTGYVEDVDMFRSARAAWDQAQQLNQFPGNALFYKDDEDEWTYDRVLSHIVSHVDDILAAVEYLKNNLWKTEPDPSELPSTLAMDGIIAAVAGILVGEFVGKRLSDYENDPDYTISETPVGSALTGRAKVVTRNSDGKVVGVFDVSLTPDDSTLASVVQELVGPFIVEPGHPLTQIGPDFRRQLTESSDPDVFDGDINPNALNPQFDPLKWILSDSPTSGNDTLYGTSGVLGVGLTRGDDNIDAAAGDDVVFGGEGDDILSGGADDDILYGQGGEDILQGDGGQDVLRGGAGEDWLYGGEGNDILDGGDLRADEQRERDHLFGEGGDDFLYGGAGADELDGGSGFDTYHVGSGDLLRDDQAGSGEVFWDEVNLTGGTLITVESGGAGPAYYRGDQDNFTYRLVGEDLEIFRFGVGVVNIAGFIADGSYLGIELRGPQPPTPPTIFTGTAESEAVTFEARANGLYLLSNLDTSAWADQAESFLQQISDLQQQIDQVSSDRTAWIEANDPDPDGDGNISTPFDEQLDALQVQLGSAWHEYYDEHIGALLDSDRPVRTEGDSWAGRQ
jgi:hypothetical protein